MSHPKEGSFESLSNATISSTTNAVTAKDTTVSSNEEYVTAPEIPATARPRGISRCSSSSSKTYSGPEDRKAKTQISPMSPTSPMSPASPLFHRMYSSLAATTSQKQIYDRTSTTHTTNAAVVPSDWSTFCNLFILYLAVMVSGLALHAWYSTAAWSTETTSCVSPECDDLREYLDTIGNLSVPPCDNFYEYVCGRATSTLRRMQEKSVYQAMNRMLLGTPRHVFPERIQKLVDYYHACYGTLMNPNPVREDFRDFIVYLGISTDTLRSLNTTAILYELLKLAVTRSAVPAISVSIEHLPNITIGHSAPLATVLKSALESGSIITMATAAMGTPVHHSDLVDALAFDTYEDSEVLNVTGASSTLVMKTSQFLGSHPAFLHVFLQVVGARIRESLIEWVHDYGIESLPFRNDSSERHLGTSDGLPNGNASDIEDWATWDPYLLINNSTIVIRNVARLSSGRATALALYTVLCATTSLIQTEMSKQDVYQNDPVRTCLEDMRHSAFLSPWNALVWMSVQPWTKEQSLRALFRSMRINFRKAMEYGASPRLDKDERAYINQAIERISLSFTVLRNDTKYADLPGFHRFRYYRNRDMLQTFIRKKHPTEGYSEDMAYTRMDFSASTYQAQVSPGALVPPLFSTSYNNIIQAAGLGLIIATSLVSHVLGFKARPSSLSQFSNITDCLVKQAGITANDPQRKLLLYLSQGLRIATLTPDARPPKEERMREHTAMQEEIRWREDRRLFYRVACSVFCKSVEFPISAQNACHTAIGNSVDFYWLFGCTSNSWLARRGVCALG
ncbi:uncharacterized protein LOC135366793 [Ornithodoros turicata]|uniref:uncharacterized protein LOC135366793 n=1 Tax=Ornithodoros turicata TaxID=34597 RepID=UPI003139CD11